MKKSLPEQEGASIALQLFHEAANRVPAYSKFLKKAGINHEKVKSEKDFEKIPWIDKDNYISKYPLNELCWDGKLEKTSYIVTSSGSTGKPYYWPRGVEQDLISSQLYYGVLTNTFDIDGSVLLVNSYGQGTWIAGTEFYNSARWIATKLNNVAVINPGIEIQHAVEQLQKLSGLYKRVVIAGYPPFIKDLIDQGAKEGISWSEMDIFLICAGESISVKWKKRVCELLGHPNQLNRVINVYGLADAGVVAAETSTSVHIRELLSNRNWVGTSIFGGMKTTGVFQFVPTTRFFQTNQESELLLTTRAGLPLVRYNTKDQGGIVSPEVAEAFIETKKVKSLNRPYIYLYGRRDLAAQLYSVNIYPENIKAALDGPLAPTNITGKFVVSRKYKQNLDQYLTIEIELNRGETPDIKLEKDLLQIITGELKNLNSEYNELSSKLGEKALPVIELKNFGEIGYTPGKKHRWVKKD